MTTDYIYEQRLQHRREREIRKALIRRRVQSAKSENGLELTRSEGFVNGTQDIFDLLVACARDENAENTRGYYKPANQND